MTLRTKYAVICNCGHEGAIILAENDQPYSATYERYTPENLNGVPFNSESTVGWNEVFNEMQISCPICSKILTPQNIRKG